MKSILLVVVKCIFIFGSKFKIKNWIVFESFLGKRLDENIYYLLMHTNIDHKFFVCKNKNSYHSKLMASKFNVKLIKKNSLKYFFILSLSRYIVTNSRLHTSLFYKRSNQIVIQLWHGIPWKKLVHDQDNYTFSNKGKKSYLNEFDVEVNKWDYLWVPSLECEKKFISAFKYKNKLIQKMYPADVELKNNNTKLNIDKSKYKRIILYMPTFRENKLNANKKEYTYTENFDFNDFALNNQDTLFFIRGHYLTSGKNNLLSNIIDVNNCTSLNSLYNHADILITDYSSAIYSFTLLNKPIIAINIDLDDYKHTRGLYDNATDDMNIYHIYSNEELKTINFDTICKAKANQTYYSDDYKNVINEIIKRVK
ncbi:MAG: CDP-glycerol glycerophosphotransferase family protein [Bacilli bacterium]